MDKVEATPLDDASIELLARRLKAIDWRPGCLMEQSASALRSLARERRRAREVSREMAMDVLAQDVTTDVLAAQREAALARAEKRGGTPLGDESLDILTMFQMHIQRVGGPRDE